MSSHPAGGWAATQRPGRRRGREQPRGRERMRRSTGAAGPRLRPRAAPARVHQEDGARAARGQRHVAGGCQRPPRALQARPVGDHEHLPSAGGLASCREKVYRPGGAAAPPAACPPAAMPVCCEEGGCGLRQAGLSAWHRALHRACVCAYRRARAVCGGAPAHGSCMRRPWACPPRRGAAHPVCPAAGSAASTAGGPRTAGASAPKSAAYLGFVSFGPSQKARAGLPAESQLWK